jgi:glycosyltransferase involved in cell wall biosynthesis
MSTAEAIELSIVVPVYNGQDTIETVVGEWSKVFDSLGTPYEFRVYDDGSKDRTGALLDELTKKYPRLIVTHKSNEGHGPTILRGYRESTGDWVFQMDSDDELGPEAFPDLWAHRAQFDFLIATRKARHSPLARRILTKGSRVVTRILFGAGVKDVNSPYRLMSRQFLRSELPLIPPDTFAPNVILSGLAARNRWRIYNTEQEHKGARTVSGSLVRWKMWKTAARVLMQTLRIAFRTKTNETPRELNVTRHVYR